MELYDCNSCIGYCCGYPIIEVSKKDIRRLARHFHLTPEEAREQFTEKENNRVRKMKQKHDKKLDTPMCIFLDQRTRNCKVYKARPQICRDHPGDRCEWHDRNMLERLANNGRKVIRLKVMPWDIDEDYPQYGAEDMPDLVNAYANRKGRNKGKIEGTEDCID